ncbi:MAG: sugar ABC transporter permease [Oscillospiraceae bacterium]|nr:sugar ABC transporter permease [Oscillospiraceae bacterium]
MTGRPNQLSRAGLLRRNIRKHWQLYLLILLPVLNILFHRYGPMYGLQIAFRQYRPKDGIWGSEWVGLKYFVEFITDPKFQQIFLNTIAVSLYSLLTFPLPIIMALALNCMTSKRYRGMVQNVIYVPHFISVAVLVGIIQMILSPVSGLYGTGYRLLGGEGFPQDIRALASSFRHIYVWSGAWQEIGWGSILYTSALAAVSPELHEAAKLDGASRFKRVFYVDLPAIMPTVAIMLILRIGTLVGASFDKCYLLQSKLNLSTSEVISTWVYKQGLSSIYNYSYGTAVSLFNTIINVILMLIANHICSKLTDGEVSYF